jgi:hypothetical protein
MKYLKEYINEAVGQVWVAIQDDYEPDGYNSWDKPRTSYRVVTAETYAALKNGTKRTYGNHEYTELGRSRNKEEAQSYLPSYQKTARKSKINKGDADYIVYAISIGKFQPNGNTKFDWNIWDDMEKYKKDGSEIYVCKRGGFRFLIGAPGSLKKGDTLFVVDNDSQKKCVGAPSCVDAVINCKDKEEFETEFRKCFPSDCKRPSISFGRKIDGLPWKDFGQMYSIKGVSD